MNAFTMSDLKALLTPSKWPCVSMFLATHRQPQDTRQDAIRMKRMLKEAQTMLSAGGMRQAEAKQLLTPAWMLLEDVTVLQRRGQGLAVFVSPELFRHYSLPMEPPEETVTAERFHIKPILPLLVGNRRFYVLALSLAGVRLLQCTRFEQRHVELTDTPLSLDESMKYDVAQELVGFHSVVAGGQLASIYHGSGAVPADNVVRKKSIQQFFISLDGAVTKALAADRSPMVLAGVDHTQAMYRDANHYANLLDEGLMGNPGRTSDDTLRQHGWEVVQPHFQRQQQMALGAYRRLAGTGRTSSDIREIARMAYRGRVEVLLETVGRPVWGTFDHAASEVSIHEKERPGDEDLTDFAAAHTILHRGRVYPMEGPPTLTRPPVACILRT